MNAPRQGESRSLWDVISASITGLAPLIQELCSIQWATADTRPDIDDRIPGEITERISGWLKIADGVVADFEIQAAKDRLIHFRRELSKGTTWREVGTQSKVLLEAIQSGLSHQVLYRYYNDKAAALTNWKTDWAQVINKFPSTQQDILAAVDCWALGYATASVFHLMRVLEYGLSAMAKDVGLGTGISNWQNVIEQIESEIRKAQKLPRGADKVDRLQFLSEAAKEFAYFKDGWRNHVSHNRATYDQHQARSVQDHVRAFMTVLSTRLSETELPSASERPA